MSGVGAAVTLSSWPTLWAPCPAARRGESGSRSGGRRRTRRSRHTKPLADTVGRSPETGDTLGDAGWG